MPVVAYIGALLRVDRHRPVDDLDDVIGADGQAEVGGIADRRGRRSCPAEAPPPSSRRSSDRRARSDHRRPRGAPPAQPHRRTPPDRRRPTRRSFQRRPDVPSFRRRPPAVRSGAARPAARPAPPDVPRLPAVPVPPAPVAVPPAPPAAVAVPPAPVTAPPEPPAPPANPPRPGRPAGGDRVIIPRVGVRAWLAATCERAQADRDQQRSDEEAPKRSSGLSTSASPSMAGHPQTRRVLCPIFNSAGADPFETARLRRVRHLARMLNARPRGAGLRLPRAVWPHRARRRGYGHGGGRLELRLRPGQVLPLVRHGDPPRRSPASLPRGGGLDLLSVDEPNGASA